MSKTSETVLARRRRHERVRARVQGTPERPRLCVFRSLRHIYVQVIDDTRGTPCWPCLRWIPKCRQKRAQ